MRTIRPLLPLAIAGLLTLSVTSGAQTFHRRPAAPEQKAGAIEEVISPKGITEQIIRHTGFTVSYNESLLIPNWVSYELTKDEASATKVSRTDFFQPDPDVRGATAVDEDYRGSRYDRGHMAAAADMKWSERAMEESFYFSNICPQDRGLNGGKWLELEQKCRWWVKKYGTPMYIVCGPMFVSDEAKYIGDNEVVVPDAFFKAVCQKRDGRWVGAVFIFPNVNLTEDLSILARPLAVGELMTGLKFFRNLPEQDLISIYNTVDAADWDIPNWKTK